MSEQQTLPEFPEDFLTFRGEDGIWPAIESWHGAPMGRASWEAALRVNERIKAAMRNYAASALSGRVHGWQPISTAPKDGSQIFIARSRCKKVHAARYDIAARDGWTWAILDGDCHLNHLREDDPTHWATIPGSPAYATPPDFHPV